MILDARNRIQWCNDTAGRQLGLNFPGDVGQPINHLLREPALQSYLETADFGQPLAGGRHRVTLAAQGDYDLLGVESELASAFGNLVSNAIRYTPEGGEARLAWIADADGAEFAVADSGIGIEKEHIPRLTERFCREDRGRSRESGGTGLGLAIVKHALARHDAVLEIESEPGKGSRFSARFPARRVAPSAQPVYNA